MIERENQSVIAASCGEKQILTVKEAAQYSGYTVKYLYKLVYQRKIKHYRPLHGRKLFFKLHDLEEYLSANVGRTREEIINEIKQRL